MASGGLDGNVKIWDPKLILQFIELEDKENVVKGRKGGAALKKESKENSLLFSKSGMNGIGGSSDDKSLSSKASADIPCRALATMSRHNGAVTSVKFSPSGQYLASGSDDKIVLIWEKEASNSSSTLKQFGDVDADLEHWTVRKRLVAHDNDVQDIAWSPDGSLLVTVGLDRLIIIWNGNTFERIKRYDIHQSMVKGIVFDPANKFFATASDDRTVRIFRYHRKHPLRGEHEFQMEHLVIDPFKKSPLTSYFRRMSWSPDGQHIAVPNATNGPVTLVAIINRGSWGTDISLIGHEAPCEVASFSPRLFEKHLTSNGKKELTSKPSDNDGFTTVLATGGQDLSLAVWSTGCSKPIVVLANFVEDSITDVCWAPDGVTCYVSCLDGSILCVKFEEGELGGAVVSEKVNDLELNRYGVGEGEVLAESKEQLDLEAVGIRSIEGELLPITNDIKRNIEGVKASTPVNIEKEKKEESLERPSSPVPKPPLKIKQNVTITKDGKKRVAPMLVSSAKPSSSTIFTSGSHKSVPVSSSSKNYTQLSVPLYQLPKFGLQTSVHGIKSRFATGQAEAIPEDQDNDNEDMGMIEEGGAGIDVNNVATLSETTRKRQRNKLNRLAMENRYPVPFRNVSSLPEFLFHHPEVINALLTTVPKEVTSHGGNSNTTVAVGGNGAGASSGSGSGSEWTISTSYTPEDENLIFSVVKSSTQETKGFSTIEIRNGPSWNDNEDFESIHNDRIDFQDPTIVTISNQSSKTKHNLYYPFKIQHAIPVFSFELLQYYALISFLGAFQLINSNTGTLVTPTIELGGNVVIVRQSGQFLLCVTNCGLIYVWKLPHKTSRLGLVGILNGVSMAGIWNCDVGLASEADSVKKNGLGIEIRPGCSSTASAYEIDPTTGSPFVMLEESNSIYQFSIDLMCWMKVIDPWYFLGFENGEVSTHLQGTILSSLAHKLISKYKEEVRRGLSTVYVGEGKPVKSLKGEMRKRYHEICESSQVSSKKIKGK